MTSANASVANASPKSQTPEQAKAIFLNELRILIPALINHRNVFDNLLSSLEQTSRSDVTFHSVETAKIVLDEMKPITEQLRKLHKLMKSRAQARMKDV